MLNVQYHTLGPSGFDELYWLIAEYVLAGVDCISVLDLPPQMTKRACCLARDNARSSTSPPTLICQQKEQLDRAEKYTVVKEDVDIILKSSLVATLGSLQANTPWWPL